MPQEQTAQQFTPQEFAAKIKTKYPAYASVPDDQLVEKITTKYPQYKTQIKQAASADPLRGAAQATGMQAQPKGQAGLEDFIKSPQFKEIQQGSVDAAKFGGEMLAGGELLRVGKAFMKPAVSMIPETSKILDAEGRPIVRYVEEAGKSAAQKASQAVIKGVKAIPAWMKANPVKAIAIEGIAHEIGVDPIQLAHKILKYGSGVLGAGVTHVP